MTIFHSQRLDDKHITANTVMFLIVFYLISALATYNIMPNALAYLTKPNTLHSIDSVSLKFDTLLANDLAVIDKEKQLADTTAQSFYSSRVYHGKLNRKDAANFYNALDKSTVAQSKITTITIQRRNEKDKAISEFQSLNNRLIQDHKDWCNNFGFWLALGFFLIELLHFPARWFCENYERKEVIEAIAKQKRIDQQTEAQSQLLEQGAKIRKAKATQTKQDEQTVNSDVQLATASSKQNQIGYHKDQNQTNLEPYHGLVFIPEGSTVQHVWYAKKDGSFNCYSQSEINRKIRALEKKSDIVTPYQQRLIDLHKLF